MVQVMVQVMTGTFAADPTPDFMPIGSPSRPGPNLGKTRV